MDLDEFQGIDRMNTKRYHDLDWNGEVSKAEFKQNFEQWSNIERSVAKETGRSVWSYEGERRSDDEGDYDEM